MKQRMPRVEMLTAIEKFLGDPELEEVWVTQLVADELADLGGVHGSDGWKVMDGSGRLFAFFFHRQVDNVQLLAVDAEGSVTAEAFAFWLVSGEGPGSVRA
jgi:hypothetical protein